MAITLISLLIARRQLSSLSIRLATPAASRG